MPTMPESMFGRPSQHLLPSNPPSTGAGGSLVASDPHPGPVQSAPLTFSDFRFNSIGKQPELLSRISLPQPDQSSYHSPTPSPTSTPPPTFDTTFQSRSSSRQTLLQQLAGGEYSTADGGSRWHAPASQPNVSLASRIQMDDTPSMDIVNAARGTSSASRIQNTRNVVENASLIPPVEVLPQPSDSSPHSPASSMVPVSEPLDMPSPTSAVPFISKTAIKAPQIPTPPASTTNTTFKEPVLSSPPFTAADTIMQDQRPSPSVTAIIDPLEVRKERLQAISTNLATLSPLPQSSYQSPSPDPSSATPANDDITANKPSQPEHNSTFSIHRHSHSSSHLSGRLGLVNNDISMDSDNLSPLFVSLSTSLIEEYQARRNALVEAVQGLNITLDDFHCAQTDRENTLTLQIRALEEQRVIFEQTKRSEEAALHHELQELQQKREELNAKEASLASLEKESKAREVARKAMLTKRQAQEEEERIAEAKRTQEVQEQIAAAMNELKEVETERAKIQIAQLASEIVPDDPLIEPQEGMDEEEIAAIKSHNDLLRAVKQLRRMHRDKLQMLEESNRTLRRLEGERKQRKAEEAELRRLVEEERLRAHAEAEHARQALDETRRDAERQRQEVENDRVQARLPVEQRAHVQAHPHGPRRSGTAGGQTSEHHTSPKEVSASQQQNMADPARIHSTSHANSHSSETANDMSVDEDRRPSAAHHSIPSPARSSPRGSQNIISQSKQDVPVSGGVMLAVSTPRVSGAHLPPKPLATLPSFPSSNDVAESILKPMRIPSAISMHTEHRQEQSFPAQFAAELNRVADANTRLTPDHNHRPAVSRTPKSQTVLDATSKGNQELNIGPISHVSPAQRNVNLRHLKRSRGRVEENDSGDRSARMSSVKTEDGPSLILKREESVDQSHELPQASLIPPRPAVIPPPRLRLPRKPHVSPTSPVDPSGCYQSESRAFSSAKGEARATTDAQPQDAVLSQERNAPVQLPVIPDTTNPLLLSRVHPEPQPSESHIGAGERPTQGRAENYDTSSSGPPSATLSHELDGEDPPRSDRRLTDEPRRARKQNKSRHPTSPTQSRHTTNSWRPQNPSNEPRAEQMRATSPILGRKRPSEFNDNEQSRRARRQRSDVWMAPDHDRDWVDSYRPNRDRRPDTEPDEHHAVYRATASPPDQVRLYGSDISRATYDNQTYVSPSSEEPAAPAARWEQSYRRPENNEAYQQYQPSMPSHSAMADQRQYYFNDVRVGQTYEPMLEERTDVQPDPSLLARMSNTQRFPSSSNPRGRGKGDSNRGRGDSGRGRGRGASRGGLLERLKPSPWSGNR